MEVDTSLHGRRVVHVLQRLADRRGLPKSITVDNGPEFVSKVLDEVSNALKMGVLKLG